MADPPIKTPSRPPTVPGDVGLGLGSVWGLGD